MSPFLLKYINDICNCTNQFSFILFADDTNIFYQKKSLKDLTQTVNYELSKLSLWFKTNKLSLNIKITNFMLFLNKKKIQSDAVKIYIDNENIKKVNDFKFLGLILDEHLNWEAQIGHISTKISKI